MKILFFGSGSFAVPVLETLIRCSSTYPLVGVVTRPDRPAHRGRKLQPTPIKTVAEAAGLPCYTPEVSHHPAFLATLRHLAADLVIVADYGKLLRPDLLDLPSIGAFNLHASLLPKYRGAAPVAYALLGGETVTGVTLFRIEEKLDAGPIVASVATDIAPEETAGELTLRLAHLAGDLLARHLASLAHGVHQEVPQDHAAATRAPKLHKEMGEIDWSLEPAHLHHRVRALNPWPLAYSYLVGAEGTRERTAFLKVAPGSVDSGGAAPGTVIEVTKKRFHVACRGGSIEVLELQREGKAAVDTPAYLCGSRLKVGDRFVSRERHGSR